MADQGRSRHDIWASEASLVLLGAVRLFGRNGEELTPKARKTRALLAVVALSKSPVPRARLTDLLWGDRGEEQAKASLRQALYELRELTGSGLLCSDRQFIGLGPKRLSTDLGELERLVATGDAASLADALEQVQWPPLSDLDDVSSELDDWLRDERSRIGGALVKDATRLAESALVNGDPAVARRLADALQRVDPLDEAVVRAGARADLTVGDRAGAHRRIGRLEERLREQLGIEPSPEVRALLKEAPAPAPIRRPIGGAVAASAQKTAVRLRPIAVAALVLALIGAALLYLLRPAAADATSTVAVLPFEEIGQSQAYFASGVSDEILNLLAHQRRLRVLGRITAAEVGGRTNSLEAAQRLGISYLLDGSVRTSGDRVLVIARLTRVSDGAQLWSERYQRRIGDIFAVQGEIATAVASRLTSSLAPSTGRATSPEVYDRYLAARQLVRERRSVALDEADRLLREALRLDPNYAPAHAELAQVIMLRANHPTSYGSTPLDRARREAQRFARRAISLDPSLGDAYAAMAFTRLNYDERSIPYYRKAVELSPQRPEFHRWLATALFQVGRHEEAIEEYRRAVAIDPLWALNYDHLIGALQQVGRAEEGRQLAQRFLALSTDERAKLQLLQALAKMESRGGDWLRFSRALNQRFPDERQFNFSLASSLAFLGERREAAEVLDNDPIGEAALAGDWAALDRAARALGRDFWDSAGDMWNVANLLLATGHARTVVELYDQSRPLVAAGKVGAWQVALPQTILALRGAGRADEAERLTELLRRRAEALPRVGFLGRERQLDLAFVAMMRGHGGPMLQALDQISRSEPLKLARIPAMSLRYHPPYAPLARDPRFEAIDERLRAAINAERAKAGLRPISRAAWTSDPDTLLTKN